ncbi:hypothetical protein E3N88_04063 [Mikania micrantha]|uniref:Uncharacterized protein n=1 Tax=Mikania micrantha TaxID=192012 RepID=A0A5N6PTC2_9ASTR|nr:hypothetical protein E3N88_04063 [Mikania micrantha]
MTRTGQRAGKEVESSSRGKRTRNAPIVESSESDEEMPQQLEAENEESSSSEEEEIGADGLPIWGKTRRLSSFLDTVQPLMYRKKINDNQKGLSNLFICERTIDVDDFVKNANEREWRNMIRELFDVPEGTNVARWPLKRANLKVIPMLLLIFLNQNILPRTSDKASVRLYEVLALHALQAGSPPLSLRHLIMWNIWEANVLPREDTFHTFKHVPFMFNSIARGTEWKYELLARVHRLSSARDFVDVPRDDVLVREEEEDGEIAGGNMETGGTALTMGDFYIPRREDEPVSGPEVTGFALGTHGSPYYSYEIAENRVFRQSMIYAQEEYRNRDFLFNEEIRHELDYERSNPYKVIPHLTDLANLPPYAETHQLPRRSQSSSSYWLPPYPQTQDPGASSSSAADPFSTATLQRSLFESIFGEPYNKSPYDD